MVRTTLLTEASNTSLKNQLMQLNTNINIKYEYKIKIIVVEKHDEMYKKEGEYIQSKLLTPKGIQFPLNCTCTHLRFLNLNEAISIHDQWFIPFHLSTHLEKEKDQKRTKRKGERIRISGIGEAH